MATEVYVAISSTNRTGDTVGVYKIMVAVTSSHEAQTATEVTTVYLRVL